ncbi:MAG: DUF3422 family protein [Sulfitobacter sp.]
MAPILDHPLRYRLSSELHARPFPTLSAPCTAAFLAVKSGEAGADHARDLAHLVALLAHYGAPGPEEGATHYTGPMGRFHLKWEQHTEFATYTVFSEGLSARAFDPAEFDVFPKDWQETLPGGRITSALLRVMPRPQAEAEITEALEGWFVSESLAAAAVLDNAAVVASDFRIDPAGHMRFAIFVDPATGRRRTGRIVQRLCEIETYKSMSMLGFAAVRDIGPELNAQESSLNALTEAMRGSGAGVEPTLHALLDVSVALEQLTARTAYRFAATGAYEALVAQRVAVLREARFAGRQGFGEFMMRRYEPAMRTVKSGQARLGAMSERARRAAELLRTRVDVARSAQNQAILASMDHRADLQLRLQRTVEGLSVVAISYYAVSLGGYLLYPLAQALGTSKGVLTAAITLPVVALVWLALHRVKRRE